MSAARRLRDGVHVLPLRSVTVAARMPDMRWRSRQVCRLMPAQYYLKIAAERDDRYHHARPPIILRTGRSPNRRFERMRRYEKRAHVLPISPTVRLRPPQLPPTSTIPDRAPMMIFRRRTKATPAIAYHRRFIRYRWLSSPAPTTCRPSAVTATDTDTFTD